MSLDADGLHTDDPGFISTTYGDRINPLTATADQIHVSDIAHALARQCRYNGHVGGYLSVARHSVWVMERVEEQGKVLTERWMKIVNLGLLPSECGMHSEIPTATAQLRMTALLHDAAEAYIGDMVRPLKHGPMGEAHMLAEARLEEAIAERFELPFPFPDEIKDADNYVLLQRELGGEKARWTWTTTPDEDEQAFLLAYRRLVGERREQ